MSEMNKHDTLSLEQMCQIKEARGYSFAQLSEYTGIPVVTLQKVFAGRSKSPRKITLDRIAEVLLGDEVKYPGKKYSYQMSQKSSIVQETSNYAVSDPIIKKQGEYTLEDYNALPDEKRVELIDGVFFEMNSPKVVHQDIASIVHVAIYNFIRKNKGKCKVFEAAVDVQLDCDNKTMVQPDVFIVCDRDKIKDFGIFGAPDFILEILSDSTRRKDMTIKLAKYENAGVKEYWILDPVKKVLIIYPFLQEGWIPIVLPLEGTAPVYLFDGELEIDLDEIMESIKEFG